MKIIVNSGNVGTPVAIQLAEAGHQVSLTVRSPRPDPALERAGVSQVAFDVSKPSTMEPALRGHEVFFSVTPLVANFVEAGQTTVAAARKAGVGRIVRMSAQGAGPQAGLKLGRWHYAVEQEIEHSGLPFTILRPANFMQNYLLFGTPESIKDQGLFYSSLGNGKVSWIDTRDISAVAARIVLEKAHEGKRYDLTGGESLSNEEIAGTFSRLLGRKITHVAISDDQVRQAMLGAGTPPWLSDLLVELFAHCRAGEFASVRPDTEMILNRKPIQFEKFLQEHLRVFEK